MVHLEQEAERSGVLEAIDAERDRFPLPLPECHAAVLFGRVAAAQPDKVALVYRGSPSPGARETLTYGALDARSSRLAALLREKGASPGDRVALFFEPSLEMLVGILAVLKAGCAYVPIDPALPPERLESVLTHSSPRLVLTHQRLLSKGHALPVGRLAVLPIDDPLVERRLLGGDGLLDAAAPGPALTSDAPIYVMYTSGTTGKPKGAICAHANIARIACSSALDVRSSDVLLNTSTYAFDGSVLNFFGALLNGATLVLVPPEVTLDFSLLGRILREERVSWLFMTTALLSALTHTMPDSLSGMRRVLFGGEAASTAMCRALFERLGPGRLVNLYGPTETGVIASFYRIDSAAQLRDDVPIGDAVFGTELYVLDDAMQPVPDGEIGELCVGGHAVGLGYLHDEEQTRRAFPTLEIAGARRRIYRTGDLVRRRPDGSLSFAGRRDDQVKINGFRVELAEIQRTIESFPGVKSAYVCVSSDASSKHLDAFVTPADVYVSSLSSYLRGCLPAYMIPRRITRVDALPLTHNGKVDRRALLELRAVAESLHDERAGDGSASPVLREVGSVGADDALEHQLVALVRRLLPQSDQPIDGRSRFDELGLSSIKRAMLLSLIRTELGRSACIDDLFAAGDCRELASRLGREAPVEAERPVVDEPPLEASRPHLMLRAAGFLARACVPGTSLACVAAAHALFPSSELGPLLWTVAVAAGFLVGTLAAALLVVAFKWLFVGRYRAGRLERSSSLFRRHLLVEGLLTLADRLVVPLIGGTALLSLWARLLGARVGPRVILESAQIAGADLVRLGAGAVVERSAAIRAVALQDGGAACAAAEVGAGAVLRARSVLMPGGALAPGAVAASLEQVHGREPGAAREPLEDEQKPRTGLRAQVFFAGQLCAIVVLVLAVQALFVPVFEIGRLLVARFGMLVAASLAPALLLAQLCINLVGLGLAYRVLVAGLREGRHALWGGAHFRWWLGERVWRMASLHGGLLAGTVWMPAVLRLYGARIGRSCEIGSFDGLAPALLTIDDDAFIGTESVLGGAAYGGGALELRRTSLASNVFVGNEAFVCPGAVVGRDVLVGSMTRIDAHTDTGERRVWIGAPARDVAARQDPAALPRDLFRPSPSRRVARAALEIAGLGLLPVPLLCAAGVLVALAAHARAAVGAWSVLLWPAFYALAACAAGLAAVLVKWIVIGRFREDGEHHLWNDAFVRRRNAVEQVVGVAAALLLPFWGTSLWSWWWRLLGARIGQGSVLLSAKLCEPDLVSIGSHVVIGPEVRVQGHTFEERRLRHGRVCIEDGATLGHRSLILPYARIADGATLLPLTLAMKGETVTRGTWFGSPARPLVGGSEGGRGAPLALVRVDALAGIPGRAALRDRLAAVLGSADPGPCTLALFELDGLQELVEREGHATGEKVLRRLANILSANLRQEDFLARSAEHQLAVLLPEIDEATGLAVVDRLRRRFARSANRVHDHAATASAGLATSDADRATTPDVLLREAERALEAALAAGPDRVQAAPRSAEAAHREEGAGRTAQGAG